MANDALVLLLLDHDVRLIPRKERGRYRFDSWQVADRWSRALLLRWKLTEFPNRDLRLRVFASAEEAKEVFSKELRSLAGSWRVVS